ncbi:MAG: hypothetical protein CL521_05160 [Actinobacteria bacterium]|nr:hypothetical protein [Actinomycetota bacterium]
MKEYQVQIPQQIHAQMIAHAQSLAPIESCGYLAGVDDVVHHYYEMTNIDNSPVHFSFDPKEQFKVLKEARDKGWQLMGVVHSHPETPARLSEEDIKLFNDPNPYYLIVSLKEEIPDVKGFKVEKSDQAVKISSVRLTQV